MAKQKTKSYPVRECNGCGKENPERISECPQCGSDKCERCDMGDDVECGNCPTEDDE